MSGERTHFAVGMIRRATLLAFCAAFLLSASASGERKGENEWALVAVAYPPDRDVSVVLGGAERTLTSKGLCKVRAREGDATVELEIENLPPPAEIGWNDHRYVLWAVDQEKRAANLGLVPLRGQDAKWKVQAPFRVFGLLVTAEISAQPETPSNAVVLESRLPTDLRLVVPVFRVNVKLGPG